LSCLDAILLQVTKRSNDAARYFAGWQVSERGVADGGLGVVRSPLKGKVPETARLRKEALAVVASPHRRRR